MMIKSKDRKIYDIKLELYSSGRVQGKVRGRGKRIVKNFIVLLDADLDSDLWVVSDDETYVLADLLVNFLNSEPEIFLAMTEIMLDERNEEEILWN